MSRRVSNYEIVREIGRGANAVVYLARHVHLNKFFALKALRIDLADETAIEALLALAPSPADKGRRLSAAGSSAV